MKFSIKFFLLLYYLSFAAFAQTTLIVPDDFQTIQDAVDSLKIYSDSTSARDTIYVRPGNYTGFELYREKYFCLKSLGNPSNTKLLSKGENYSIIKFINSDASATANDSITFFSISGFTLSDSELSDPFVGDGGALRLFGVNTTVENCTFTNNKGSKAGAIKLDDANLIVRDCRFIDEIGTSIFANGGSLKIYNCLFENSKYSSPVVEQTNGITTIFQNLKVYNNIKGFEIDTDSIFVDSCFFINNSEFGLSILGASGIVMNSMICLNGGSTADSFGATLTDSNIKMVTTYFYNNFSPALVVNHGNISINNSYFFHNNLPNTDVSDKNSSIFFNQDGGSSQILNSIFYSNQVQGTRVEPDWFSYSAIQYAGIGEFKLNYCDFIDNGFVLDRFINNDYGWIDATNNYWGSASGPFQELENPEALGDTISNYVNFQPFFEKRINDYYLPPNNFEIDSVVGTNAFLSWVQSPDSIDNHYLVYFSKSIKSHIFDLVDSIFVSETGCVLENLSPYTTYRTWVKAISNNNASSFYSNLVEFRTKGVVGIENDKGFLNYVLSQNYPNPFNPTTVIKYEVPKSTTLQVVLYNSVGQKIRTLVNKQHSPGYYSINFDGSKLSSGVYFYQIIADDFVDTKKMVLIK